MIRGYALPPAMIIFGLCSSRQPRHLVVIDALVIFAHAVRDDFVRLAREVELVPVRQVSAVSQVHSHDVSPGCSTDAYAA